MKILHVTNLVSHHQLPIARHLASILGLNNFRFAALDVPNAERLRLGWSQTEEDSWILRPAEIKKHQKEFEEWWKESDIVICSERLFYQMKERLVLGKPCLYMSERWWKPPIGMLRLISPKYLKMVYDFSKISRESGFHYLAIGPFAAKDISKISDIKSRIWQWGYFPPDLIIEPPINKKAEVLRILWAGRMLDWKRVDTLIKATAEIQKEGVSVELTLIGEGAQENKLAHLANRMLNPGSFNFIPPIAASKIPEVMREHNVYVLPSTATEGWGVVINEAMASGMAVIASSKAGASAAMIENGINGLLFQPGNWKGLANQMRLLAHDRSLVNTFGKAAQGTVNELWSARVAADRLIDFSNSILERQSPKLYDSGPLSPGDLWLKNFY